MPDSTSVSKSLLILWKTLYTTSCVYVGTQRQQELTLLLKIDESFRKIVITSDDLPAYTDDHGIVFVGLFDFLLGKWEILRQ